MFPHDRDLSLTTHLDGEIRDGRHHMQVRVYYEDNDFSALTLSVQRKPCAATISLAVRRAGNRFIPDNAALLM
jgi:hypothetical protein